jgi:hypothetical protein
MLYKVTPNLTPQPAEKKPADPNAPKQPRKKRKSAVYDADDNEVLITMMCLKCRGMKPLAMFGLRKMADGAIRNQPWCRNCRSGAGTKKPKEKESETVEQVTTLETPAPVEAAPQEEKQPQAEALAPAP